MTMKPLIYGVMLVVISGNTAADSYVMGTGTNYCQKVLENPSLEFGNISWVQGFISGLNWQQQDNIKIDSVELQEWIYEYCKQNRFKSLATATVELYKELLRRREKQQ